MIGNRYEIASHSPIVLTEHNSLSGCFQRGTACEVLQWVVTHQAHARHLRSWGQALGHVIGEPCAAPRGQGIHGWSASGLKGCFATQRLLGCISRAIWNHDQIFHAAAVPVFRVAIIQHARPARSNRRFAHGPRPSRQWPRLPWLRRWNCRRGS